MDITEYIIKQRDASLIFIKSNLLAVGNGNHLLFIDIQKGIIVDQQALNITGHIIHVISDAVNNKLLITTSDEIVLHSLYTSIND
jgi:ligand-binding sensor domain-containing protein